MASPVTGWGGVFGALGCVCLRLSVVRVLLRLRILGQDQSLVSENIRSLPRSSGICVLASDTVRDGFPQRGHGVQGPRRHECRLSGPFACPAGRDEGVLPTAPRGVDVSPCVPRPQNGELIYGCADARSPAADWNELAHHLKPFFFPSNGLAGGPHCTRAVIRELVRVITRVLLSGSDKGRAGALRRGPAPRGPRVCEASPFGRSLRRQGRPRRARGRAEGGGNARGLPGLTELLREQPGARPASQPCRRDSRPHPLSGL